MAGKRLVLFGAGMTGRGQVAQLAFEDGWELTFVDRDRDLVHRLRQAGRYTVRLVSERPRDVVIAGYRVLGLEEEEAVAQAVAEADLVVTAVRPNNLSSVAPVLAKGLVVRLRDSPPAPLNVIAAENMNESSATLWAYTRPYLAEREQAAFGFPNSMIARVVPVAEDPLLILAEDYNEWTADAVARVGEPPSLAGLEWVPNQTARLQRKLYIHNTGHATCAYLGLRRGHEFVHEAAQDPWVLEQVRAAISDSGRAVAAEFGLAEAEVRAYAENLLDRLPADALPDRLARVVREPIRKLGPDERFLGPLRLCERHDLPRAGLCVGIAAVLAALSDPSDPEGARLAALVRERGPVGAVEKVSGCVLDDQSAQAIAEAYARLGGNVKKEKKLMT